MWTTPAASAASTISRASATVIAIGFSHSTCLPVAIAASAMSWWTRFGVAMIDGVDAVVRAIANGSVVVRDTPVACAARSSATGLTSQRATIVASGHSATPGTWLASAMPPVPISATRIIALYSIHPR